MLIDLSKMGAPYDTIHTIALSPTKNSMPDPNLLAYILHELRQYLPDDLPLCELNGLGIQLICIKNKWIKYLCPPMPDKPTNP
ncbi:MAG: hypothetical protein AAB797_01450 [Patescibacteria group bacterium]